MAGGLILAGCSTLPIEGFPPLAGTENPIDSSAAGNYLAGRHAGIQRDTGAAARFYARALEADPGNVVILERAFLLDVASGDIEHAALLGRRMLDRDPESRMARLVLAIDAIEAGEFEEAAQHIESGSRASGADIVWATVRAWAYAGAGDFDESLAILRAENISEALGSFGQYHEALILDLAGRPEAAYEAYSGSFLGSEGRSVRVLDAFGRFLERTGHAQEAASLYETYLSAVPDHPVIVHALRRAQRGEVIPERLVADVAQGVAEALYGVGVALAPDHAPELPVIYVQLALHLRPDFVEALALMGDLHERQGSWADAARSFERIPQSSPVAQLAAVSIARNWARLEKNDEAIDLMQRWAGRGDADIDTLVTLGDLYRSEEEWLQAAKTYDLALAKAGELQAHHWQLVYAKGIALERAGRWADAESLFQRALELEPDQPHVLNYLGYSWIDRGENLSEALSLIDRAVAQRPDDGYIVDSLGWAYYRMGDFAKAVYYLERAVELKPEDVTINDHLGDAYWRVGRRLEARFQWTHALGFNPSAEDEKKIKRKLQNGLPD